MIKWTKQLKRREFLQKGILGGVLFAVFPRWESNSQKLIDPSHKSYEKLLKIARTYGGEFGNTRGGL